MHKLFFFALFNMICTPIFAGYYSTLPKGVRAFEFRHIFTNDIASQFNESGINKDIRFKENLNAKTLAGVSEVTKNYLNKLKALSPEAYDAFSFGEYQAEGSAKVDVQVVGGAVGITDKLTAYIGLPIYNAEVSLQVKRTGGSNHQAVSNMLSNSSDQSSYDRIYAQIVQQLPDATGGLLQGILVNQFGYKPVGDWKAKGLGDTELGFMYRISEWDFSGVYGGLLTSGGFVLPTGREDDPDIIQDIPFGDGQTDVFAEFGGGIIIPRFYFGIDSNFRYTYQTATEKNLRIPSGPGIPIGYEKGDFRQKLGNKFDFNIKASLYPNDWLTIFGGYMYSFKDEDKYESSNKDANKMLAMDTMEESHSYLAGMEFSTVNLFKKGKFWAPLSISPSMQKVFHGLNTPAYTRYNLNFRLFF